MAAKIDEEPPFVPPKINPFWKENARKLVGESISTMESVAKEIIVVAGLLEGLYFHAITFSDLRGSLSGDLVLVYLATNSAVAWQHLLCHVDPDAPG